MASADVIQAPAGSGGKETSGGAVLLTAPSMHSQAAGAAAAAGGRGGGAGPPLSPDSVVHPLEGTQQSGAGAGRESCSLGNTAYFKSMQPAALFDNRRRKERVVCEVNISELMYIYMLT